MSDIDGDLPSQQISQVPGPPTLRYDRYDLSGRSIPKWTTRARKKLVKAFRRLCSWGSRASKAQLPGTDEAVGNKAKKLPGKAVLFAEAKLDETGVSNQLKQAQTETEFLRQELHRAAIEKTRAETKGQKLENLQREIEIRQQLMELTDGRTDISITYIDGEPSIIFGNLPVTESNDWLTLDATPLDKLKLPSRVCRLLLAGGIASAEDLAKCGRKGLGSIKGIGDRRVVEIAEALAEAGFDLGE